MSFTQKYQCLKLVIIVAMLGLPAFVQADQAVTSVTIIQCNNNGWCESFENLKECPTDCASNSRSINTSDQQTTSFFAGTMTGPFTAAPVDQPIPSSANVHNLPPLPTMPALPIIQPVLKNSLPVFTGVEVVYNKINKTLQNTTPTQPPLNRAITNIVLNSPSPPIPVPPIIQPVLKNSLPVSNVAKKVSAAKSGKNIRTTTRNLVSQTQLAIGTITHSTKAVSKKIANKIQNVATRVWWLFGRK